MWPATALLLSRIDCCWCAPSCPVHVCVVHIITAPAVAPAPAPFWFCLHPCASLVVYLPPIGRFNLQVSRVLAGCCFLQHPNRPGSGVACLCVAVNELSHSHRSQCLPPSPLFPGMHASCVATAVLTLVPGLEGPQRHSLCAGGFVACACPAQLCLDQCCA